MLTCYGLPENVYLTTQIQLRRLEKSKRMFKVREAIQKKCTVHVYILLTHINHMHSSLACTYLCIACLSCPTFEIYRNIELYVHNEGLFNNGLA